MDKDIPSKYLTTLSILRGSGQGHVIVVSEIPKYYRYVRREKALKRGPITNPSNKLTAFSDRSVKKR